MVLIKIDTEMTLEMRYSRTGLRDDHGICAPDRYGESNISSYRLKSADYGEGIIKGEIVTRIGAMFVIGLDK